MTAVLRILVVEDDPQIRQLNYLILKGAGYRVDVADDGQTAWELVWKNPYDLVVTDNSMPRLKGVEFIGKMRSAGLTTPVILAAADMNATDALEFQGMALAGHLVKPFGMKELLGTVKAVLDAHAQRPGFSKMWSAA